MSLIQEVKQVILFGERPWITRGLSVSVFQGDRSRPFIRREGQETEFLVRRDRTLMLCLVTTMTESCMIDLEAHSEKGIELECKFCLDPRGHAAEHVTLSAGCRTVCIGMCVEGQASKRERIKITSTGDKVRSKSNLRRALSGVGPNKAYPLLLTDISPRGIRALKHLLEQV